MSGAPIDYVDLKDDVPNCEDSYYRCVIKCLRISRGWIDLLSTIGLVITSILSAVAANNSDSTSHLSIITAIISGTVAGLRIIKDFAVKDEAQTKQLLREVIAEHKGVDSGQNFNFESSDSDTSYDSSVVV